MDLCYRLKQIREWKNLSQGDIEERTGLLRCYISRVENGHTVPSIETLEKLCRALEVPMYQLFYTEGPEPSQNHHPNGVRDWTSNGKEGRMFSRFIDAVAKMSERDRSILLHTVTKMTERKTRKSAKAQ
jgi:transcriptional regulator with XRE-family HTH domain